MSYLFLLDCYIGRDERLRCLFNWLSQLGIVEVGGVNSESQRLIEFEEANAHYIFRRIMDLVGKICRAHYCFEILYLC